MIHVFGQQQIKTPIFSLCKAYISKYNFLSVNFSKCVAAAHMEIGVLFSKNHKNTELKSSFFKYELDFVSEQVSEIWNNVCLYQWP